MRLLYGISLLCFLIVPAFAQQPAPKISGAQLLGQQLGNCMGAQAGLYDQVNALNDKLAGMSKQNENLTKQIGELQKQLHDKGEHAPVIKK